MIARKDAIDKIVKFASLFVQEVKSYNSIGNYDVNIHAENTLIPILNAIFEINLVNVNQQKKNHPSIDLADDVNGVAFQITSTSTFEKVSDTLKKFVSNNLFTKYPTLYIYILTEKESKYNAAKIEEIIPASFNFNADEHILDFSSVLKRINYIVSVERIANIAKLYEHEFSEIQIEARSRKFIEGYLSNTPESIYLNLVKAKFPRELYMADTNYNKGKAVTAIKRERKKGKFGKFLSFHPELLLKTSLGFINEFNIDYVVREEKVITFRNLNNASEPLSKFIDKGTIEMIDPSEYYSTNDDYLNTFKDLLKKCLRHLCFTKGMEWEGEKKILRFRNDEIVPRQKSTVWRGKKESTKTVIFEMMSKKKANGESHIICFRSMAFKPSFHLIDDQWYLCINPTWSFTNPGGIKTSRYESDYMSGLKRMESNNTVYYQFRFFAYFLSNTPPLFVEHYPYLKIEQLQPIQFLPSIDDSKWLPSKDFVAGNAREAELFIDDELKSTMI